MPIADTDYNAFATTLVRRFAERARGLDQASSRIVNQRPADHVLAGFLTPVSAATAAAASARTDRTSSAVEIDDVLADDLPRDSAYEQTAVGLEWITPIDAFGHNLQVAIEAEFFVYVRRLPSFSEQSHHAIWQEPRRASQGSASPGAEATPLSSARVANLVPVWTRERISGLRVTASLDELRQHRRMSRDLSAQIRDAVRLISLDRAYPSRQPIAIEQSALTSAEAFAERTSSMRAVALAIEWRAAIDIRLSCVPTQPGSVRLALRIINHTEPPGARSLDYVDPNLYAVALRTRLPRQAHQPTIFHELPASFRYNREMVAIGINAQAVGNLAGEELLLETDTVPQSIVPRLEPREIADAIPEFAALASNPLPTLRRIHQAMERYDAEAWQPRITALAGLEREEATAARQRFREEFERFGRGIDLLADDRYPSVKRAFTLMNEAMGVATRPHLEWRLFQIVFIVSQLSGLAAREYPELARDDDMFVDILWFAAGGGKTEAFLGLIVWQAFFDRLRGKGVGVTALVRFPLRLLTFQQLQRLAAALAAAEVIRKRGRMDGARFSMGYFVGSAVTPNTISNELHARYVSRGVDERLQRVFQCPFCTAPVQLGYDEPANRDPSVHESAVPRRENTASHLCGR